MRRILVCIIVSALIFPYAVRGENDSDFSIFLAGDVSCADLLDDESAGWGQLLPLYLKSGIEVHNYAKAGRSSKSFISEARWDAIMSQLGKGDYVFIQFGQNDRKTYDPRRYAAPYGEYYENLRKFVNDVRRKHATPILLTPVARHKFIGGVLVDTHGDYPNATRTLAVEMDVCLIELTIPTMEFLLSLGEEASREYFVFREVDFQKKVDEGCSRNSHKGADYVVRLILNELIKQNIKPLCDYIDTSRL